MENVINLIVGDWSWDGHGKTETITIKSNLTSNEVEKAFEAGASILGYNIKQDCCRNFEDNFIPIKLWNAFLDISKKYNLFPAWELGEHITPETVEDTEYGGHEETEEIGIDSDLFCSIYLVTCKIGNENFVWETVDNAEDQITIGGYGLFYA